MGDMSVELARWLQEAGRRRGRSKAPALHPASDGATGDLAFLRRALLLVTASASVAQYCYADTMLQILSIHSVLVFVFTGASG